MKGLGALSHHRNEASKGCFPRAAEEIILFGMCVPRSEFTEGESLTGTWLQSCRACEVKFCQTEDCLSENIGRLDALLAPGRMSQAPFAFRQCKSLWKTAKKLVLFNYFRGLDNYPSTVSYVYSSRSMIHLKYTSK